MKIKIHETILYKFRLKNMRCSNYLRANANEKRRGHVYLIFFLCIFLTGTLFAQKDSTIKKVKVDAPEEENLNVFHDWITWNNPGSLVLNHLNRQAEDYYTIRDHQIAGLKTKSDWKNRQQLVKEKLNEIMGPFPKRGGLNPEITGIIQKDGYRIEKIIYESVPGFYETGCLYIPDNLKGSAPAILNVIGH